MRISARKGHARQLHIFKPTIIPLGRTSFAAATGFSVLSYLVGLGGSDMSLTSVELCLAVSVLSDRAGNRTFLFGLPIMVRAVSNKLASVCYRAAWSGGGSTEAGRSCRCEREGVLGRRKIVEANDGRQQLNAGSRYY